MYYSRYRASISYLSFCVREYNSEINLGNKYHWTASDRTMKIALNLAVLCALARKVSATCGGEMPNQPQPGETQHTSIMVDDPNYGQVDILGDQVLRSFLCDHRH